MRILLACLAAGLLLTLFWWSTTTPAAPREATQPQDEPAAAAPTTVDQEPGSPAERVTVVTDEPSAGTQQPLTTTVRFVSPHGAPVGGTVVHWAERSPKVLARMRSAADSLPPAEVQRVFSTPFSWVERFGTAETTDERGEVHLTASDAPIVMGIATREFYGFHEVALSAGQENTITLEPGGDVTVSVVEGSALRHDVPIAIEWLRPNDTVAFRTVVGTADTDQPLHFCHLPALSQRARQQGCERFRVAVDGLGGATSETWHYAGGHYEARLQAASFRHTELQVIDEEGIAASDFTGRIELADSRHDIRGGTASIGVASAAMVQLPYRLLDQHGTLMGQGEASIAQPRTKVFLNRQAVVKMQLLDDQGKTLAAGTSVRIATDRSAVTEITVGEEGRSRLRVTPGVESLHVVCQGIEAHLPAKISNPAVYDLGAVELRSAPLRGTFRVTDAEGKEVSGAHLTAYRQGSLVPTRDQGDASFQVLQPSVGSEYLVKVEADGFVPYSALHTMPERVLDIVLTPSVSFSLRLRLPQQVAEKDVFIYARKGKIELFAERLERTPDGSYKASWQTFFPSVCSVHCATRSPVVDLAQIEVGPGAETSWDLSHLTLHRARLSVALPAGRGVLFVGVIAQPGPTGGHAGERWAAPAHGAEPRSRAVRPRPSGSTAQVPNDRVDEGRGLPETHHGAPWSGNRGQRSIGHLCTATPPPQGPRDPAQTWGGIDSSAPTSTSRLSSTAMRSIRCGSTLTRPTT